METLSDLPHLSIASIVFVCCCCFICFPNVFMQLERLLNLHGKKNRKIIFCRRIHTRRGHNATMSTQTSWWLDSLPRNSYLGLNKNLPSWSQVITKYTVNVMTWFYATSLLKLLSNPEYPKKIQWQYANSIFWKFRMPSWPFEWNKWKLHLADCDIAGQNRTCKCRVSLTDARIAIDSLED